jgi:hypothetical protein
LAIVLSVLLLLAIVLSVLLRFTDSHSAFGIFKLFLFICTTCAVVQLLDISPEFRDI